MLDRRRSLPPHLVGPVATLLVGTLAVGCLSGDPKGSFADATLYVPPADEEPESLGYFLARYDKSLQRWTELKLSAKAAQEFRTMHALEGSLTKRAKERQDELVAVLETGAPTNREVAAVALGFTGDPSVLSPLLAALSDTDPMVIQKALLGVGILGLEETPLSQIEYLLLWSADPWTRNNAAFALQRIVAAGARSDALAASCRQALIDEEPGVRAQAASVLGIVQDTTAIPMLGDLLADDVSLVAAAAAAALAQIGHEELTHKGEVARLLVQALERASRRRRPYLHEQLIFLADRNLGDDVETWKEWAYRMP